MGCPYCGCAQYERDDGTIICRRCGAEFPDPDDDITADDATDE